VPGEIGSVELDGSVLHWGELFAGQAEAV
jgi:hypothetical protein